MHSSRLRFYSHMFFNMEIGFPDRKEQNQTIDHIQAQSAKIDKAVAIQEQMTDDSRIQIYQSPDGETQVDVRFEHET